MALVVDAPQPRHINYDTITALSNKRKESTESLDFHRPQLSATDSLAANCKEKL